MVLDEDYKTSLIQEKCQMMSRKVSNVVKVLDEVVKQKSVYRCQGLTNASKSMWYKGCFVGEIKNNLVVDEINGNDIVNCAKYCHHKKYKFIGIRKGSNCVCITNTNSYNGLTRYDEACNKRCFGEGGEIRLRCGGKGLTWSIYQSDGPYIQHLNSTVPGKWIVMGEPVILDAYIYLATYTNISTEIIARNHISSSTTTANLTVLEPAPQDLQIFLISPKDHVPSCIPLEHDTKPPGPLLTVFSGETVRLEISVAVGVDLTFTIQYGDTEIVLTETPDIIEKESDGSSTAVVKLIRIMWILYSTTHG
ncbi:hypothetical protein LOTGIDRAFT_173467 [Lottia gigantea]|uniref:WSC domain-containing protein n=1 Tax=Lottia gigantea TaxID=225164 RepID=V4B0V9_LOTGI|nr:hypothetical protein LOTGIDRAFT_173467 [Lottia gigantea]ESO99866.1 hypothetical protein LOTGIDRAFT_173467 [Lottia gigantea]